MERLEDRKDLGLLFLLAINVTPEGSKPQDGSVRSDKRRAVKASEVAADRGMLMFPSNTLGTIWIWRMGIMVVGDARVMTGISCFQRVQWRARRKCPDSFD